MADALRLRQLLVNLLHNAVKFTDAGTVRLRGESRLENAPGTARIRFSIHDTGIGIAPEKLETIFDAFSQVDSRRRDVTVAAAWGWPSSRSWPS